MASPLACCCHVDDVVVNTDSGGKPAADDFVSLPPEDVSRVLDINLTITILCNNASKKEGGDNSTSGLYQGMRAKAQYSTRCSGVIKQKTVWIGTRLE